MALFIPLLYIKVMNFLVLNNLEASNVLIDWSTTTFNNVKFVRSRQPGIISLMSYSLLWFVKINTELLRGVFTTQRFDTPV